MLGGPGAARALVRGVDNREDRFIKCIKPCCREKERNLQVKAEQIGAAQLSEMGLRENEDEAARMARITEMTMVDIKLLVKEPGAGESGSRWGGRRQRWREACGSMASSGLYCRPNDQLSVERVYCWLLPHFISFPLPFRARRAGAEGGCPVLRR